MHTGEYTFGDNATASERLALVHRVFAAPSVALLARLGIEPRVVVDLGCGPGHTAAMLHARFPHALVVGVERSATFAAEARARVPDATIVVADAIELPLRRRCADVVYCRLLLAHLADVAGAIACWRAALGRGGAIVIDEVESIESDDAVFTRYEDVVGALVASRGARVCAGPRVAAALEHDAHVEHDEVVEHRVAPADAAAMFAMNLTTWRHDPWVVANVDASDLDALADGLARPDERGPITWRLRHTIVAR